MAVWSATYTVPVEALGHSDTVDPKPEARIAGRGLAPEVNDVTSSTLPASEDGSSAAAGFPALPVATTSSVGDRKNIAPMFPVAPFGMPVRIGLGTSPGARRTMRLSAGVVMYA